MSTTMQPDREDEGAPVSRAGRDVRLRVRQGSAMSLSTLQIDAPLRHDVIATVQALLYALRVQIVRTHAQVTLRRVVRELEIAEFDGAPVSGRRAHELELLLARELAAVVIAEPVGPCVRKTGERAVSGVRLSAPHRP